MTKELERAKINQAQKNYEKILDEMLSKSYARWEVKEEIKTRFYEAIVYQDMAYLDKDMWDFCPDGGDPNLTHTTREQNETRLKNLGIWQYAESLIKKGE